MSARLLLVILLRYNQVMLYVFHGTDIKTGLEKAKSLINSLRAKRPDATFVPVEANQWSPIIIEENLGGQGLFSNKYIIFLDRMTENIEAREGIADFIPAMNESSNIFIVLEGKLNADLKKAFEKSAEKVVISEEKEISSTKKEFNIFNLADALGARDSFKAWSIYRQAIDNGLEVESIAGTLFWQVKSMLLAQRSKTAAEAGLNPFVYEKSKEHSKNYSADELSNMLNKIVIIYHDGHRGRLNMELGVERMMLIC